jgi:putative sigma-54 modulation protein
VQVEITPRNYQPSARIRESIERQADKFLRYADVTRVRYTLTGESVQQICEIHLHLQGKDFHAKSSSEDMLNSIDRASESMERQLRRRKTRRTDSRKARFDTPGLTSAAALEAAIRGNNPGADEEPEES